MAENSYFFDNNQDYSSADWAKYFSGMISTGVNIFSNTNSLKIVKDSGMRLKLTDGTAYINGYYYNSENGTTVTLAATSSSQRIDRIVLRLNLSQDVWSIIATVKQGSSSAPPSLQRDNTIYEISLAKITIPGGQSTLNAATITDERGDASVCGFLRFLGTEPYYPPGNIPASLWMYETFPNELTAAERQVVESNPGLMAKYNASRGKQFYNLYKTQQIRRDVNGKVMISGTPSYYRPDEFSIKITEYIENYDTGITFSCDLSNFYFIQPFADLKATLYNVIGRSYMDIKLVETSNNYTITIDDDTGYWVENVAGSVVDTLQAGIKRNCNFRILLTASRSNLSDESNNWYCKFKNLKICGNEVIPND